nr:MAG TPA: hypothetical protein [Caudoviricetes sp.]DAR12889.1 MAG TPA: hypothetical protein [Caudoviricetes sp.]
MFLSSYCPNLFTQYFLQVFTTYQHTICFYQKCYCFGSIGSALIAYMSTTF